MADDEVKGDIEAQDAEQLAEDAEMAEPEGEHVKTEEELEEELKETKITIPRYSPHNMPDWKLDDMRSRWQWHLRIYPIDQEDCRNCILDTVTKISQEAWYYVPKRKNGEGVAELTMATNSEAKSVMARVVRMPFYHNFVTLELYKKKKASGSTDENPVYEGIEESATIVFDSSKCEKIKNTASSKGGVKRRTLWVRYLSDDTTPELLRVVFPFAQSAQLHTHEELRLGEVRANSKTDVLLFMKGYLTVVINNKHVLALQNKEYSAEGENAIREDLETNVTPLESLEVAPVSVAERSEPRKEDKNLSARVLKRTLQQQQKAVEPKRKDPMRNRSGEPPAKRGGRGNWGDRYDGGRRDGGRAGGGRYGGGGGGYGGGYGGPPRGAGFGGGMLDPHGMAAEMMMMQAQLNHTIQNQLMMLGPGAGGGYGGGGGGRKDGRRGGRGGRKW